MNSERRGRSRAIAALLLAAACAPEPAPRPPALPALAAPALAPVVDEALARLAGRGLPELDEDERLGVVDLLDLWSVGGAAGERAGRALEAEEPGRLAAALLAASEDLHTPDPLRRAAAAWLAARAPRAALPRLTLRLKYEKDYSASVDLARALVRLGSGAGLEALVVILQAEAGGDAAVDEARGRAAAALRELPAAAGWEPGASFAEDWERLLALRGEWDRTRVWGGEPAAADADLEAEFWRTLALLRSQPLRPVDDARFVLARAPADDAYGPLLAATRERDRYVRDHVLEVASWIGPQLGAWADRGGVDAATPLAELIGEPSTRARAIEALGALGQPQAAPWILPWLSAPPEEATAAADALLRCADARVLDELRRARATTPEAAFSLALLLRRLEGGDAQEPQPPAGLDPAEAARRRQWDAARAAVR